MMDNETRQEAIDGETVDLFAFMNSSIVELQIEMEMLENKEYQKDDNCNDIGNGYRSKPPTAPKPIDKQNNPMEGLETTITTAKPTTVDWQSMEPAKLGDQDYSPVSDYSPGKTVVVAGVQERQDDSLSSNVPQPFATVTPAKVGDADYVPVSDYTNRANAETIANAMAKAAAAASKASVTRV